MNQMSVPVRLLYYLNISKEQEVLINLSADAEAFRYYLDIASMTRGFSDAEQITKKIMKILKGAV